MLKKIIAYQRLLLNSTPPINIISPSPSKQLLGFAIFCVIVFMNIFIFMGSVLHVNTTLVILLPVASIWMINNILYGDHRLFEAIPVKRQYTVLNVFLMSIVISSIAYLLFCIGIAILIGGLVGFLYIKNPQNFTPSSPSDFQNIINTTKGDVLILCIFLIIIFGGVAITFIKNKYLRLLSFAAFTTIGYGLLILLKLNLKVPPGFESVEFLESFSIMPKGNTILICVAIATVIISIMSIFMGYKLYVAKPNDKTLC